MAASAKTGWIGARCDEDFSDGCRRTGGRDGVGRVGDGLRRQSDVIADKDGSTTSKVSAQPTDYTNLLIQATDIDAPVAFTGSPPGQNPNGQPGVATTFSTQDASHTLKTRSRSWPIPARPRAR